MGGNRYQILDQLAAKALLVNFEVAGEMCYCWHKMLHVDLACQAPMDICITLNTTAESLIRHGHARAVDASEGLELLALARENNLLFPSLERFKASVTITNDELVKSWIPDGFVKSSRSRLANP